jgi:predicted Zn-dependent protease
MTTPSTSSHASSSTASLLDRANLDRDSVRHQIVRGLTGADDGELFLEYSQTEALMFDNGRLKQATYDTSQGFGLRAVKDDAVGYAHSSDVSLPAPFAAATRELLLPRRRTPMCASMATKTRSMPPALNPR